MPQGTYWQPHPVVVFAQSVIVSAIQKGMVEGMEITHQTAKWNIVCEPCYQGKQPHKPIPKESDTWATEVLYHVHSDFCEIGESREGYCYYARLSVTCKYWKIALYGTLKCM